MPLTRNQRMLVHQVHPGKLAVDIGASAVSNLLLWRGNVVAGVAVRYVAPVLGTALVLRLADLDSLAATRRGKYVLEHMPPPMMGIRLGGDMLMAIGAWKHRPAWLAAGAGLVLIGWSGGLLGRIAACSARTP